MIKQTASNNCAEMKNPCLCVPREVVAKKTEELTPL